jgi:Na+-translocating ferredoxin:NAD+ oxidoreductase RNF subunit RnfB
MASDSATLKINHEHCTQCRMCYVACRALDVNAVYVALEPLHRIEIDPQKCAYPGCTVCLAYCPAEGSIIEAETGRSMVPPPPDVYMWSLKNLAGSKSGKPGTMGTAAGRDRE